MRMGSREIPLTPFAKGGFRSQKGFGLAESLVSVALLGTAVVSLLVALSTGSMGVTATRDGVMAQSLAQSQMAYTKSYPFDEVPTTYPLVSVYDATYNPNPLTVPARYSITVEAGPTLDSDTNIQKITVSVSQDGDTMIVAEDFKVNR